MPQIKSKEFMGSPESDSESDSERYPGAVKSMCEICDRKTSAAHFEKHPRIKPAPGAASKTACEACGRSSPRPVQVLAIDRPRGYPQAFHYISLSLCGTCEGKMERFRCPPSGRGYEDILEYVRYIATDGSTAETVVTPPKIEIVKLQAKLAASEREVAKLKEELGRVHDHAERYINQLKDSPQYVGCYACDHLWLWEEKDKHMADCSCKTWAYCKYCVESGRFGEGHTPKRCA